MVSADVAGFFLNGFQLLSLVIIRWYHPFAPADFVGALVVLGDVTGDAVEGALEVPGTTLDAAVRGAAP
jgi:hypothetical protein